MAILRPFNEKIKQLFLRAETVPPPAAGVYHYLRQTPDAKSRLHLRIEEDGRGLLLVNANRAFHLNPTAATMAYLCLEEIPPPDAIASLTRAYRVSTAQAAQDLEHFSHELQELISPEGACPVCELDLEITAPFSQRPTAPYRMDLAITYRCNNACAHCYNARPRSFPELSTGQWKQILDLLWQIGIPHIVFTGGEPTLRRDLPELIAHAEQNGQITGINTNGRGLKDAAFLDELVSAGLDHVQITLESHAPEIHDEMVKMPGAWVETVAGLKNALAKRLFVMTNTTLLQENSPHLSETLEFLGGLGVPTIGLNALIYAGSGLTVGSGLDEASLPPLLEMARTYTDRSGQRLIWYTPTQYCHFDPVQMQLGVKGCTAALYNMCVEPNGSVIPCQSYYETLGNLLEVPWEEIWNHELALSLRERRDLPADCITCDLLTECGGGCPLQRRASPSAIPIPAHPLQVGGKEVSR